MRNQAAASFAQPAGPVAFLNAHPLIAACSVAGATSAAALFAMRAGNAVSHTRQVSWSALALLELMIAGGIAASLIHEHHHEHQYERHGHDIAS